MTTESDMIPTETVTADTVTAETVTAETVTAETVTAETAAETELPHDAEETPEAKTAPRSEFVQIATTAALDLKAEALTILDLSHVSDFTEFFLVCSGKNDRQVKAIANRVRDRLREGGLRPLHVEGETGGRWVLLDYGGEMVIHVFEDETRQFYALERLWSDAPVVTSQYVAEE